MLTQTLSLLLASLSVPAALPMGLGVVSVVVILVVVYYGTKQLFLNGGGLGAPVLPCLPWVPVLGSLPWLGGGLPPHLLFTKLGFRYGPLFALYLGPHYTVVINDHQQAKEVLLQRGREFAGRPSMVTTELLTRGGRDIAFAEYSPVWKFHRRLVHNSFTLFGEGSTKLQDIVLCAVDDLCSELLSNQSAASLDPLPAVTRAVTNVVCTLVFGSTYRRDDRELQEVMSYNQGIVQTIATGGLVDIYPWIQVFPNRCLSRLKECIRVRDRLLARKLLEHKATLSEGDPRDLLDALLKGQTEKVQERVQTELDDVVGFHRPVCLSDRACLKYLDCVINEGMRIRPVSPVLIPHTAMKDSSIGGHSVRMGTRVLVNMWSIHHDPKHWDKPDLFNPDRFLDNEGRRVTPPCFLPFGAGPRVCLGESLARMELFLFLGSLLQRMSFKQPKGVSLPDLQGQLGVVLQPLPYKVMVTPRAGWEGGAK